MFNILKKKKKHVIFIMLDQFRRDFVSSNTYIESTLKQGVFFSNAITYAPYTVGAMHAVFSGMYGNLNGANCYYGSKLFKDKECATMAEYFQKNGYTTYGDTYSDLTLPRKGFDHYSTFDEEKENHKERHMKLVSELDTSKPVFAYFHYGFIHTCLMKDVLKKYDDFSDELFSNHEKNKERYAGYIASAGNYLQGMIEAIKSKGIYDDSMIIILTDHGSSLGEKKGEKAYGSYTYQYTINTWFSILNSGFSPREIKERVRTIDLLPTLLNICNFKELSYPLTIQGDDLTPMIKGKEHGHRIACCETAPLGGYNPSPENPIVKCILDGDWKYIVNTANSEEELYNIKDDPTEKNNLIESNYQISSELRSKLDQQLGI